MNIHTHILESTYDFLNSVTVTNLGGGEGLPHVAFFARGRKLREDCAIRKRTTDRLIDIMYTAGDERKIVLKRFSMLTWSGERDQRCLRPHTLAGRLPVDR